MEGVRTLPNWLEMQPLAASPPIDNMGGVNATVCGTTSGGPKGFAVEAVRRGDSADYFYRLALDTLQVSVKGSWANTDAGLILLDKRRRAEAFQAVGFGQEKYAAPDGRELIVHPHGGRPAYQVLMRDGDGLEVRALPSGPSMPGFILRFGARWCVENSVSELGAWVDSFVRSAGFLPAKVMLSEVHVRCDTPVPFTEADLKGMRGAGTRHGRFNTHHYLGRLSGIDNLGGKKNVKFVIYDKRLEQTQKEGALWPSVWASFGISPDTDIWRAEARWGRKGLLIVGLDELSQLTDAAIRMLWHRFASEYILFVQDPDKRTSRTVPTENWARMQACGQMMETQPVKASLGVTATQLIKQATGCIAKAMAVAGMGHAKAELDAVIAETVAAADTRFSEERAGYIKGLLKDILERYPDEAFSSARAVKGEIESLIDLALSRKALAQPFNPAL